MLLKKQVNFLTKKLMEFLDYIEIYQIKKETNHKKAIRLSKYVHDIYYEKEGEEFPPHHIIDFLSCYYIVRWTSLERWHDVKMVHEDGTGTKPMARKQLMTPPRAPNDE